MRRTALVSGLLLLLASGEATAQRSGGRFGGSRSFGSSRGSYGSSSRSSSYSGSSYRSPSSYGSSSSYRSNWSTGSNSSSPSFGLPPLPPRARATLHVRPAASYGLIAHTSGSAGTSPASAEDHAIVDRLDVIQGPLQYSRGFATGVLAFAPLAALTVLFTGRRQSPGTKQPARGPSLGNRTCTVRRISVAFDWSRRAQLQSDLDAIAARVDTSSVSGLFAAAERARDLLRAALGSARYGMFQSIELTPADAEAEFARQAKSLRGRFEQLTIAGRTRTRGPDDLVARREEGAGLVVVSLVVATTTLQPPLPNRLDADSVSQALADSIPSSAEDLVGLEVVWSPSEDADRLSSAELEAVYPELLPLRNAPALGRVSCGYCHAIYARELLFCPACSANDPRASRAAASGLTMISCRYCGRATPAHEVQCQHCGARAAS